MSYKHHIIRVQHLVPDSCKGFPNQELNDRVRLLFENPNNFIWLEYTNDVSGRAVDAWIDWCGIRNYKNIGLFLNLGVKKPPDSQWERFPIVFCDNNIQSQAFYHKVNEQKYNTEITAQNKKILFLTGKPLSTNRLPVLDLLDKSELKFTASLFWNNNMDMKHATGVCDLSENRILELVNKYQGSPDHAQVTNGESNIGAFHMAGVPYDHSIYQTHQLSLVPETKVKWDWEYNFCTEKTFRTIFNHHPFIILSQPGTLKHLKDRGYDCFQEFLPYPKYDQLDISTPQKLRENWPHIEKNCQALLDSDPVLVFKKCQSNYQNLVQENEQILESAHRATEHQIDYGAYSYDAFYWGVQPDNWVWPSWNTERRKFKK